MTEIHVGTSQTLFLDLYNETADALPTAIVTKTDGSTVTLTVNEETAPTGITERYSTTIGLANTSTEGELEVEWSLSIDNAPVTKTDHLEVVTPYLTISEVKAIAPEADDQEALRIEQSVRHIINSHTGQSFGYARDKTITVEGHGESALRLPQRLIRISGLGTLTADLDTRATIIVSDGWYLKKAWADVTAVVENDSQFWGDFSDGVFDNSIYSDPDGDGREPLYGPLGARPGGVIVAPGSSGHATAWKNDYPFRITGDWGYKTVPANVKEAARLLANDYACMENAFRDRYLDSIKAADWRLQFNSRAWESTGNVRADQLLSEYVLLDWAVV